MNRLKSINNNTEIKYANLVVMVLPPNFLFVLVVEVNAVLESCRHRDPTTGGKEIISSTLVNVVKQIRTTKECGIEESNHKTSAFDTLEIKEDLVPCLR